MSETPTTADLAPSIVASTPPAPWPARPTFAHASEGELARILDFYQVRWEYEPHVFPILWSLDGAVVESFSPDFYLPDLDLHLELTTLRQPLVRRKNRKLRRLRELYPDVRIKLFYGRDFRALMLKYGKLGLADGLSGTSGQVPPPVRRPSAATKAIELAVGDAPVLEFGSGDDARLVAAIPRSPSGRRIRRPREDRADRTVHESLPVVPASAGRPRRQ